MNRVLKNLLFRFPFLFSDRRFLELVHPLRTSHQLCLDEPKRFNDKIQYLKLYDRKPLYTTLSDKVSAKDFAAGILGPEAIIPTLGVYDRVGDIPWESLPSSFVLKCTHDSGGLVICRDKAALDRDGASDLSAALDRSAASDLSATPDREASFDRDAACAKLRACLKRRFFYQSREWCYKDIKPRILCEPLMGDERQKDSLIDYKFFCFNSKPRFMYISSGLEDHSTARISFADLEGRPLPFRRSDYRPFEGQLPLPQNLPALVDAASRLAAAVPAPFLRVDLYEIGGKPYFSEFTFYPNGGYLPFDPPEWDEKIGEMLNLHP